VIIARDDAEGAKAHKRLSVGVARTRAIAPEEIGRPLQATLVADAVVEAMQDAGITDPADVHYVQVKGPLLTPGRIADADARGMPLISRDPNGSKPVGRGILALGVAAGLGEIRREQITEEAINRDFSLFSAVASTSVGGEVEACEIVLMGNRAGAGGSLVVGHGLLGKRLRHERRAGCAGGGRRWRDRGHLRQAEPAASVFGCRTTMMSDADIHAERHARAALSGTIGAATGETAVFISGGTEHQCPPGMAPIAVVATWREA
jgi:ring-opening amidohydrolases